MTTLELLFRQVLAASLSASILAAIVWLLQVATGKRLGPAWRHALWLVVLVRLLVPILPESRLSLFNAAQWFQPAKHEPKVTVTFHDAPDPSAPAQVPLSTPIVPTDAP